MAHFVAAKNKAAAPSTIITASLWIGGIWAAVLCWAGRREMLDDALIHLRYAEVLHDRHFISFDGIHPSYGASSLLYVGLLALLRSFTTSPLLPKAVSLIAYAGMLIFTFRLSRANRLAVGLLLVLVSPFGIRWLTDGMETSLACLLSMTFSALVYRRAPPIVLALVALTLSVLRVDLTLLVAFAFLLLLLGKDWVRAAAVAAGSGVSLLFIRMTMGYLLPDTAVAKVGGNFLGTISQASHEIAATLSFGAGALILWIVSAALAWRVSKRSTLVANLPFPVLVTLAAIRGQQIHGIRYVIWSLLFSIVWNLLGSARGIRLQPIFLPAFACLLAASWVFELPILLKVDRGRAENLAQMEHAHLEQLHGTGLAGDVGFIGYFSKAPVCDINGLINGRAAAAMTELQRARICLDQKPDFLFLTDSQLYWLNLFEHNDLEPRFLMCGAVDFTNVIGTDRHSLLVRRTEYPRGCPTRL